MHKQEMIAQENNKLHEIHTFIIPQMFEKERAVQFL